MTGNFSKRVLMATTGLALATGFSGVAQAQTEESAEDGNVIIVTAQKREENVQEVPISITAIGGDELVSKGISDVTKLDAAVPGLSISKSGSDARPSVRGVRTVEVDLFNDPTIGFFVDGVYKARTSQALAAFVDLERVEVLRGPQGTLYGRNTYGGSIGAISKKPQFDFGAEGNVTYGNFNDLRLEGIVNVPVGDNTAFRVVGVYQESDGYVNVLPSRDPAANTAQDFNDNDQIYVRGSFRHDFDVGEIIVRVSHWDQEGFGAGGFGYTTVGTLQDAAGNLDVGGTLNRTNPRTRSFPGPSDVDPYNVYRNTDLDRDIEETTANMEVNLELGGVILRSISAWSDFQAVRIGDEDFSDSAQGSILTLDTDSETISQEFQLVSDHGGPFTWVVGGYYFSENGSEDFIFLNEVSGGAFTFLQEVDTDSYAVFAQGDYAFGEQFKITVGGRYTVDDKRFRFRTPTSQATPDSDSSDSFDKFTWKVGAEFTPTPDNLIYASVSTGFRSGGANNQFAPTPNYGPQTITAYEIGSKNTFANGQGVANISFFYNDMNDILSNTFVQVGPSLVVARSNGGSSRAYGAELELAYDFDNGFKVDANFSYLNAKFQTFTASAPSGYGLFTGFDVVPGTTNLLDLSGNEVPISPTFTGSIGASYEFDLGGSGTLTPAVQFFFSDSYFVNEFNYDAGIQGRDVGKQGSYTKTDASLTWMDASERFMLQAFVRNLEDEAVLNAGVIGGQGAIFQNYAPPRTYGVRAGFKF